MTDRVRRAQVRWRMASPRLRSTALAIWVGSLTLGAYAVLNASDRIDATSASVLVAVVFGVLTVQQQRQNQRRQHTVNLINQLKSTDGLAEADLWMADRIAAGLAVDADTAKPERGHVMTLLDYYEFLAVLAQRGLVDVPLLLDLRGGAMTRCFDICRDYIEYRRIHVSPGLYGCLEIFAAIYSRRAGAATSPSRDRAGDMHGTVVPAARPAAERGHVPSAGGTPST